MKFDLQICDRCGKSHKDLEIYHFTRPEELCTHWSVCPETAEPILMKGVVELHQEKAKEETEMDKEKVDLIFVVPNNFLCAHALTRRYASNILKSWFDAREQIKCGGPQAEQSRSWLEYGTFAYNIGPKEGDGDGYSYWAVAWNQVIGIYTREIQDHLSEGDEWKKGIKKEGEE